MYILGRLFGDWNLCTEIHINVTIIAQNTLIWKQFREIIRFIYSDRCKTYFILWRAGLLFDLLQRKFTHFQDNFSKPALIFSLPRHAKWQSFIDGMLFFDYLHLIEMWTSGKFLSFFFSSRLSLVVVHQSWVSCLKLFVLQAVFCDFSLTCVPVLTSKWTILWLYMC